MKIVLITLNMILAALLVWGSVGIIRNLRSAKSEAGFTVKKKVPAIAKTKKESTAAATPATVTETEPVVPLATQVENIIKTNIFNQERCPNSGIFGSTRVEMTLVGTFTIGKTSGAIILQKAQTREMPFMPWMNQGQMGQQRQQGIGQRGGMNGNMGPNQNQNQGTGSSRRQMGSSRNTTQFNRSGMSNLQGTNIQGTNIQGTTQGTAAQQKTYKQYVRLGETLSNGYKLVEVARTRVVLTRGSDKLELELADASKNQPQSSSTRRSNPNQTQVMQQMLNSMQQMQQMQMMQGFQMMRMGQGQQQNQQGPQQSQNSGRNGTAARSRR